MSVQDSKEQEHSPVRLAKEPLPVEIEDTHYEIRRETTGEEFLLIREESAVTVDGVTKLSPNRYEHANLRVRLTLDGKSFEDDALRGMPRIHYQTLATLATQIDNEESGIISDFLSKHLREFPAYRSALERLSSSRQSGSESPSKSPTGGKKG